MVQNCELFLEIVWEVVNICSLEDRITFQNKYWHCCETEIRHLKYYENTSGWWHNERWLDSVSLVIPTLLVKREFLALRAPSPQKILISHCYLTAHAASSFGVNALSQCVLLLEDASDHSFWEHLEKMYWTFLLLFELKF